MLTLNTSSNENTYDENTSDENTSDENTSNGSLSLDSTNTDTSFNSDNSAREISAYLFEEICS